VTGPDATFGPDGRIAGSAHASAGNTSTVVAAGHGTVLIVNDATSTRACG
jgi:hypothetical protein